MLATGTIFAAIGVILIVTRKRVDRWNARKAMEWQRGPNKNEDLGREGSYAPWYFWAGVALIIAGLVFTAIELVR